MCGFDTFQIRFDVADSVVDLNNDVLFKCFQVQEQLVGVEPSDVIIRARLPVANRNRNGNANAPDRAVIGRLVGGVTAEAAAPAVQAVAALQINLRPELVAVELNHDVLFF